MQIAIVGGSPSSQFLAPFDDLGWEIWVLGNQLQKYKGRRVTRIFEIHENLSEHDTKYPEWLVNQGISLIVSEAFPLTGSNISIFEKSDIALPLLSSSPAYMMAQAVKEGADKIAIYGVDMAVDDHEYFKQRPDMYAWISYAIAKGIDVIIPEESSLFKPDYDEGRDWNKVESGPFTELELLKAAQAHIDKIEELRVKIATHDGARQVYERLAKVVRSGANIKTLTETMEVI